VPAAYASAVLNATVVQELAETLPPGYLRREDLSELGAPLVADAVEAISEGGVRLADLVTTLIEVHGSRFPRLSLALREDLSLHDPADDAWSPPPGGAAVSGRLPDLAWVEAVRRVGGRSARVRNVTVNESLFGLSVIGQTSATGDGPFIAVDIGSRELPLAEAVAALFRGVAVGGGTIGNVEGISASTDSAAVTRAFAADRAALGQAVAAYRAQRQDVDDIVEHAV
jgi:hypothetical protein